MANSISLDGVNIEYLESVRYNVRNTYLRFDDNMLILVSGKKLRDPERLIEKHKSWVIKHYSQVSKKIKLFQEGKILYHGAEFEVQYQFYAGRPSVDVNEESYRMVVKADTFDSANLALLRYIKKQSLGYAKGQAEIKARSIDAKISNVKVRKTKRWGACNSKKELSFTSCMSMLPYALSDYVIAHEVAHLKELNHSRRFWATVEKLNPDYKSLRKELQKYDTTENYPIR